LCRKLWLYIYIYELSRELRKKLKFREIWEFKEKLVIRPKRENSF